MVIALLAAAPAASAQAPAPAQYHGVQLHPLWNGVSLRQSDRQLGLVKGSGADVVRVDVAWASIEQNGRNQINWGYVRRTDAFLRRARARGLKVILTLAGTPCWAARAPDSVRQGCGGAWWDRGVPIYPPRRAHDYAHAAVWVARRWGRELLALEVWNEPNHPAFFRSRDPVRSYSSMLRAAYLPIKRAAPGLVVLGGSLALSDGDFLAGLYDRGHILGSYDAISYHPYTDGRDPSEPAATAGWRTSFVDGTRWLRDTIASRGDPNPQLWITEVGATTCTGLKVCVDERKQARQIQDFIGIAAGWPYVRAVVIYSLRDNAGSAGDPAGRFGMLRRDLSPKPAWAAFQAALAH